MTDDPQAEQCPGCQHPQHAPGTECETRVNHGPNHFHVCLCLARPGAEVACPPQMTCQGGTLGYTDVWYLQRGHSLSGANGETITPDVLKVAPAPVPSAPADRAAVLREAADALVAVAGQHPEARAVVIHWGDAAALLRTMAQEECDELEAQAHLDQLADELPRMADETQQPETGELAAALDGLHTLIATSSRDWQTHRVDAWIWAVLCGWDCEQDEHDETCTHGALEETAAMHGWDADTVAKARRYRAAVRAITEPAAAPQPGKEA